MSSKHFDKKCISVHHVGARSGSRKFPTLNKFEKDIINVLYEADRNCVAQIEERNKHLESALYVLPYCLGDACKTTYFNVNYDPYTSSLLDPNPDYKSYYFFYRDHDYIISEATEVMEKRPVELVTIDHIFQTEKISIPPPDFLSIDTQGSEYEILEGARETLRSSVVALAVEVEFYPFYKGQKLFGELTKLLLNRGFDFVKFLHIHELSPYRAPIGLRAEGFQTSADALFFRRIRDIDNMESDEVKRYLILQKLAFIAIVFNQFEYGLQCLSHMKDLKGQGLTSSQLIAEPTYCKFLKELKRQIEKMPKVFPQTFTSKYTFEASSSRFESSANRSRTGLMHRIKELLRKSIVFFLLLRQLKYLIVRIRYYLNKLIFSLKTEFFTRYSDVESVLIKYDFKIQAKALKKNRVIQSKFQKR